MTFIDPTDVHMTGAQADLFAGGAIARMEPDHSTKGAWWIKSVLPTRKDEVAFRLRTKSDALVAMARIACIRPEITLDIPTLKENRNG